jgi:hypothetical protein
MIREAITNALELHSLLWCCSRPIAEYVDNMLRLELPVVPERSFVLGHLANPAKLPLGPALKLGLALKAIIAG